jgi:hypothetical protein
MRVRERTWLAGLILPAAFLAPVVLANGAGAQTAQTAQVTAHHKPGPPGESAEGQIKADIGTHLSRLPCLTASGPHPGARVYVAPCTTKLNADQRWRILRIHQVIIVGLTAHPGSCLGAVPEKVKQQRKILYIARTYDCGQQITLPEGLLLGHIGSIYNTISQAQGGKLLSAARKLSGFNRYAQWLRSNGNIPYAQVWLFPKFKRITP